MDLTDFGQSNPLHTIEFYKKLINLCNEEYLICKNESSIVTNSIMICMIIIIILLLYLKFR